MDRLDPRDAFRCGSGRFGWGVSSASQVERDNLEDRYSATVVQLRHCVHELYRSLDDLPCPDHATWGDLADAARLLAMLEQCVEVVG